MSYLSNFERSFSEHTLQLVQNYDGKFPATLMVNCLLGLLVVPRETALKSIPEEPLTEIENWGVSRTSIKNVGRKTENAPDPETLRGFVSNLRHSVAHFRIEPVPANEEVHSFKYVNDRGFEAVITISEMRAFVTRLSEHLAKQ
jgi:HEPN pEK499 p136